MTWTDPRADGPPEPRRHRRTTRTRLRWAAGTGAALLAITAAVLLLQPGSSPTPASSHPGTAPSTPFPTGDTAPHLVAGVLVGFPRTQAGARAAALNVDVAIGGALMYGSASRHSLLQAIAVPDRRTALQAAGDTTYTAGLNSTLGLDANGKPVQDGLTFVARRVPVGSMVAGWTPDAAVVQVWTVSLNGLAGQGSTTPVRAGWETDTVTLQWAAGDWRYVSQTGVPGPVPVVGAQSPSDSAALAAAATGFGAPSVG